jgi:hypothetical protein
VKKLRTLTPRQAEISKFSIIFDHPHGGSRYAASPPLRIPLRSYKNNENEVIKKK